MSYARKRLIKEVCSIPTAPFREHSVGEFVKSFCRQRNIQFTEDRFGNIIACYGNGNKNPIFGFSAHMDHPGFIVESDSDRGQTSALFYGGVDDSFFKSSSVRIFTDKGEVTGTIHKVKKVSSNRCRRVSINVDGKVKSGDLGMWDLPPFSEKRSALYSRACDDLVGCATILCMLDECVKKKIQRRFLGIFTCAEEAGLHGAKQLCKSQMIPDESVLISVETSSRLPGISLGDGVVIRVGDKRGVFNNTVLNFINETAALLKNNRSDFNYKRKLMDGGRCEASVYQRHGYLTGAVCVPLANYHNRNREMIQIQQEYVNKEDVNHMIDLCMAIVDNSPSFVAQQQSPTYESGEGNLGEYFLWET